MHIEAIDPKKTAMIVVDMQNDFVASGAAMETPAARHIVPQLAKALRICRESGIKIIYTAHVHRSDGCDMGQIGRAHVWTPVTDVSRMPSSAGKKKWTFR